jgi:hypothetical protein
MSLHQFKIQCAKVMKDFIKLDWSLSKLVTDVNFQDKA